MVRIVLSNDALGNNESGGEIAIDIEYKHLETFIEIAFKNKLDLVILKPYE